MGTAQSEDQHWLELYNAGRVPVSLDGWLLTTESASLNIPLYGRIAPGQTLLLAHTSSDSLGGVPVHIRLPTGLPASGDSLRLLDAEGRLVDTVDAWHAGCDRTSATMQRVYPYTAGTHPESWSTATIRYDYGFGTPGFRKPPSVSGQELHYVFHDEGTINIFFNQHALTHYALPGNEANHRINLEERIIERLRQARDRIDIALYEINLPDIVDVLLERAAEGVTIRLLVDAKPDSDEERNHRFRLMRIYLEQLARGLDGRMGSRDGVHLFANSPIFAVTDPEIRLAHGLPAVPSDLPYVTLHVGDGRASGHLLAYGAEREPNFYYGPSGQMHNKFVLIDNYRVLTGSMNFTETGIYGTYQNRLERITDGNSNNLIDIHSPAVTAVYRQEFDLMWGSNHPVPDSRQARFRSMKPQGTASASGAVRRRAGAGFLFAGLRRDSGHH